MTPVALDPDQTFDLWLDIDIKKYPDIEKGVPDPKRPTFVCRFMSSRKMQIAKKFIRDKTNLNQPLDQYVEKLYGFINQVVVGWKNMLDPDTGKEIPFKQNGVNAIANDAEAFELLSGIVTGIRLTRTDEKKSASQSRSDTGKSATPRTVRAKTGRRAAGAKKPQRKNSR